jgi:hypothetical protein
MLNKATVTCSPVETKTSSSRSVANQAIGFAAHGGNDHDNLVARIVGSFDFFRDGFNPFG